MDRRSFLALLVLLVASVAHGQTRQHYDPPSYPRPSVQFFDDYGVPARFASLCTYAPKSSVMKSVYQTAELPDWPHPNPVRLDNDGRATIFLAPGGYRFVLLKPGWFSCEKRHIDAAKPSPVIRDWTLTK